MISGILSAILFLFLCSKAITKHCQNQKINSAQKTMHKAAGILFLVIICVHMILVLPLLKQRPFGMYISGCLMLIFAAICISGYFLRGILKQKWFVIHKIVTVLIFLCLTIHICLGIRSLQNYQSEVAKIEIQTNDANGIADGTYIGEYDVQYIYVQVQVSVKDEKIEKIILLEHRNEKGKNAENIINTIIEQQQVEVDAVTHATNSSRVIMKAVENALEKGKTK